MRSKARFHPDKISNMNNNNPGAQSPNKQETNQKTNAPITQDPREDKQEEIDQETDTARLRSEKKSVEDGSGNKDQ